MARSISALDIFSYARGRKRCDHRVRYQLLNRQVVPLCGAAAHNMNPHIRSIMTLGFSGIRAIRMVMANTLRLVLGVLAMLGVLRLKHFLGHVICWLGTRLLLGEMSNRQRGT